MAKLLFRLRQVTEEEAEEVRALLRDKDFDCYETQAGFFGTGVAAIWLRDESRWQEASQLLKEYQDDRQRRVRQAYREQREMGQADSFFRRARQHPLRLLTALGIIALVLTVSLVPFWDLLTGFE